MIIYYNTARNPMKNILLKRFPGKGMDGQQYPMGSRPIQKHFQIAPVQLRTLASRTRSAQVMITISSK